MVIHDINQDKQETIVLIHPMNFSGHGKAKDNPYISTTEEAATLACYLKEHDLFKNCSLKELAFLKTQDLSQKCWGVYF